MSAPLRIAGGQGFYGDAVGPLADLLDEQPDVHYPSPCDPRLNARQSLDLAFRIAELLRA